MSVRGDPGSVGVCAGVVRLQGRLPALSAVLSRGVDGNGTCVQPQGGCRTGASERKSPSLPWRRLFSPSCGSPRGVGKSSLPAARLAHGTPRYSQEKSYSKPQHHHCPAAQPISTLTRLSAGPGDPIAFGFIRPPSLPQSSRAPDRTCNQVNCFPGLGKGPVESTSALRCGVDEEEVINLFLPLL